MQPTTIKWTRTSTGIYQSGCGRFSAYSLENKGEWALNDHQNREQRTRYFSSLVAAKKYAVDVLAGKV